MSLLMHLGPVSEHLNKVRQLLPRSFTLTTTQKVIVVSVTASVAVVGVLARYLRRKKRVVDPSKVRRVYSKRIRGSGMRSPNGDVISQASSGRRSAAYSNVYGDRLLTRQGSIINSERASVASGSLTSGGLNVPDGASTAQLTPQQIGVMALLLQEVRIKIRREKLISQSSRPSDTVGLHLLMTSYYISSFTILLYLREIIPLLTQNDACLLPYGPMNVGRIRSGIIIFTSSLEIKEPEIVYAP